jgi:hypothetical protein
MRARTHTECPVSPQGSAAACHQRPITLCSLPPLLSPQLLQGFLPNISVIPHAMACAGSPARAFLECYAFAGELEACRMLPQCTPLGSLGSLKNLCVPKAWLQQKLGALRKIFAGLSSQQLQLASACR